MSDVAIDILNFKPKFPKILEKERLMLKELGFNWCPSCKSVKPLSDFYTSSITCCRLCKSSKGFIDREKRPEYAKKWREAHPSYTKKRLDKMSPEQRAEVYRKDKESKRRRGYGKIHYQKYKSKVQAANKRSYEKYKKDIKNKGWYLRRLERSKYMRKNCAWTKVKERLRNSFYRTLRDKKQSHFELIGLDSYEKFMETMSLKCQNPNWALDGYEIDHIWQVNWFYFPEDCHHLVCGLLNHHRNLRPLTATENKQRGKLDFSPLEFSDLPLYWPFLKNKVKLLILEHFEIPGHYNIFNEVYKV